jgi:hypothetical protein
MGGVGLSQIPSGVGLDRFILHIQRFSLSGAWLQRPPAAGIPQAKMHAPLLAA